MSNSTDEPRSGGDYEAALRELVALTDAGAAASQRNRRVDELQRAFLTARTTPTGREAIMRLAADPNPRVRGWAATHMLDWDPTAGRAVLEQLQQSREAGSFEARWTLVEYDRGGLVLDWEPGVG